MSEPALPPLIAIVGPTSVGKSSVALMLASTFGGEIVCADSRTQYRGLDIGSAKPTAQQRARVHHHLLDLIDPDGTLTLAQFQKLAYQALVDITSRQRIPFLVGGSGLYVKCVVEGFRIPEIEPNYALRLELNERAQRLGGAHVYEELMRVDPLAAQRIGPTNTRRIIRALEVYYTLGAPISQLQSKVPPPYRVLMIGLTRSAESLNVRISERVDAMLAAGLAEEVRGLLAQGYSNDLPAMSGIGYREMAAHLRGEIDTEATRQLIAQNSRRFVRRQYQWFRLSDRTITWFDLDQAGAEERIRQLVAEFAPEDTLLR